MPSRSGCRARPPGGRAGRRPVHADLRRWARPAGGPRPASQRWSARRASARTSADAIDACTSRSHRPVGTLRISARHEPGPTGSSSDCARRCASRRHRDRRRPRCTPAPGRRLVQHGILQMVVTVGESVQAGRHGRAEGHSCAPWTRADRRLQPEVGTGGDDGGAGRVAAGCWSRLDGPPAPPVLVVVANQSGAPAVRRNARPPVRRPGGQQQRRREPRTQRRLLGPERDLRRRRLPNDDSYYPSTSSRDVLATFAAGTQGVAGWPAVWRIPAGPRFVLPPPARSSTAGQCGGPSNRPCSSAHRPSSCRRLQG
jgi:hypothetical protein